MEVEVNEDHLRQAGQEHPVPAALRQAGFVNPALIGNSVVTGRRHQWSIKPKLRDWLDRQSRDEPVRGGILSLDPRSDTIEFAEFEPTWTRIREFHQPPPHHARFRFEFFCPTAFAQAMQQQHLDFEAERPRLEQGNDIVIEIPANEIQPACTITLRKDPGAGDPRRRRECQRCIRLRLARRDRLLPFLPKTYDQGRQDGIAEERERQEARREREQIRAPTESCFNQ